MRNLLVLVAGITVANAYVQELTDANFFGFAKDKEVLLVDFYAPWCSDCQRLAPEYEKASNELGSKSVDLAKVDCFGAGKGLCTMYGVKSWPQLKNFNRGTYTGDYNGEQTAEAIAGYINTVENSIPQQQQPQPFGNPYAMAYPAAPPVAAAPAPPAIAPVVPAVPQAYHAPAIHKPFAPAAPMAGPLTCAKCKISQVPGSINSHCSKQMKRACVQLSIESNDPKSDKQKDEEINDKKRSRI